MKIPSILVLLSSLALASAPTAVLGQSTSAASSTGSAEGGHHVEVAGVKFGGVRSSSGDTWLEVEVDVIARPDGRAVMGEFVDNVRVVLSLGFEVGDSAAKKWSFYRANVEAVSLEGGVKSVFRFYLPPEILKRDRVPSGDAGKHFVVEFEVGGRPTPPMKGSASARFASEDLRRSFLTKVVAEGARNEGVLVPQHLSPFALDSQRRSPSIVRRDGSR
jgi:hypothetical protein